jgi:hypothetical protein
MNKRLGMQLLLQARGKASGVEAFQPMEVTPLGMLLSHAVG